MIKPTSYSAPAAFEVVIPPPLNLLNRRESCIENCYGSNQNSARSNKSVKRASEHPTYNSSKSSEADDTNNQAQARGIPRRKLLVLNILQHQLAETRQKRLEEQQQEYIKNVYHQQQHKPNKMTINHDLIVDEKQVNNGMFSELKSFLHDDSVQFPLLNTHSQPVIGQQQQLSTPPPLLSTQSLNQVIGNSTMAASTSNIEPTKAPILPFNIDLDLNPKKQEKKHKQSKEFCAKIIGVPSSYTISDIHDLVLERCSIICNQICIKEKRGKRTAILDMKSKKEAQEVKKNIEGIKVELHELKVRVIMKKKNQAANSSLSTTENTKQSNNLQIDYKITESVEDIIGYTFSNKSYLMIALTHGHPTSQTWIPLGKKLLHTYLDENIFEESSSFSKLVAEKNDIEQGVILSTLMRLHTINRYLRKHGTNYQVVSATDMADCFLSLMYSIKEDCHGAEEEIKISLMRMYHPLGCLVCANITEEEIEKLKRGATADFKPSVSALPKDVGNLLTLGNEINYELLISEEYLGKGLHFAARKTNSPSSIKTIIRKGADPDYRIGGYTPLMVAKSPAHLKVLIQAGARLEEVSQPHKLSVMACAVERKSHSIVKYLINHHDYAVDDQVRPACEHALSMLSKMTDEKKKSKMSLIIETLQSFLSDREL
ncbi:predicted protein [Naegleria gruberi]|uniref:Predicted protein n=1 Tax=Naegleria gruberi TaxID=5762 RepID=D2VYG0_NAEGR|nr:uncharacterized protein NAEGRDRAFT_59590 [Naegleria gruberi]EFC38053.1 predicted protein [Naegleria gruberi]|eukprot:XP_002670797.1 predicted protein [Naegleria gruberi strain NEG-M]